MPRGAIFIDPYDNEEFVVEKNESLSNFTTRIKKSRESKGLQQIQDKDLHSFVAASLYESTPSNLRDIYFEKKMATADIKQMLGLAKTMATELVHGHKEVSGKDRQRRALKCLGCKLHRPGSYWSGAAQQLIKKIVKLEDVKQSKEEKRLGTCGMCGCGLQQKVNFRAQSSIVGVSPDQLDTLVSAYGDKCIDACWITQEIANGEDINSKKLLRTKLKNGRLDAQKIFDNYIKKRTGRDLE